MRICALTIAVLTWGVGTSSVSFAQGGATRQGVISGRVTEPIRLDLKFEIKAALSLTDSGWIRLHPTKVRVLGVNGESLLHALGLRLDNMLDLSKSPAARVKGDDIYLDPTKILPPPAISGRLTSVRVEGADYLTWNEVRALHSEGIEFGSHSVTHADFRSLGPEQIGYELGYSKETIEQRIGAPVESFSYPFALPEEDRNFTRYLADTLQNVGYSNGVSSTIGRAKPRDSRFFLPRLSVNSWDDVELLRAKLEGGYDWLHWPQWFYKFAHHNVALMTGQSFDQVGSREIRS